MADDIGSGLSGIQNDHLSLDELERQEFGGSADFSQCADPGAVVALTQSRVGAIQAQQAAAVDAAKQAGGDADSFTARMDAARDAATAQTTDTINAAYDRLDQIAATDPGQADQAAAARGTVGDIGSSAQDAITSVYQGVMSTLGGILGGITGLPGKILGGLGL